MKSNAIIESSKVFESNIRLQMLASLSVSDVSYKELKELCHCSDGNMATHTKKLISEKFISVRKEFINNKPCTTYILTEKGRTEFLNYINLLKNLIEEDKK